MAYLCIIASVPQDNVDQIRIPADISRLASRVACVSHFIAPASTEVREALDGGNPMKTDTSHPLRGFMFHMPTAVREQASLLASFTARMRDKGHTLHDDTWAQNEVTKLAELFQYASDASEAVVTHLDLTRTS